MPVNNVAHQTVLKMISQVVTNYIIKQMVITVGDIEYRLFSNNQLRLLTST